MCFHFYGLSGVPTACLKHLLKLPVNHTSIPIQDIRRHYQNYTELLTSELLSLTTNTTWTILQPETIKISVSEVNTCLRAHTAITKKSTAVFPRNQIQQTHWGSAMLTHPFRHSVTALRNVMPSYISRYFSPGRLIRWIPLNTALKLQLSFAACHGWLASCIRL